MVIHLNKYWSPIYQAVVAKINVKIPQCMKQKVDTHSLNGFLTYTKKYMKNNHQEECYIQNCFIWQYYKKASSPGN